MFQDHQHAETNVAPLALAEIETIAAQGNPALADSQIYVTLANRPDLDNRYTVFGHVTAGDDVPARLERGDLIRKVYLKP